MNSNTDFALQAALKALTQFLKNEDERRQERHDTNTRYVARSGGQVN